MARPSIRELAGLLREAFLEWRSDNCLQLGAALAYYTLFSIAPLLLIAIALAALFFGDQIASGEVMGRVEGVVGQEAADTLRRMVERASRPRSGIVATAAGLAMTAMGASSVFGQLQWTLNTIWDVPPRRSSGFLKTFLDRLSSFSMILVIGLVLLISLAAGSAIAALSGPLSELLPGGDWIARGIDLVISLGISTLLFAMIFKILPDASIRWTDVWIGAAVTSVLFAVGRLAIAFYLGRSTATSVYGAAGSLVVLLLWVYYSAQLLFLGAEFTQVYARRFGSLRPEHGSG